MLLLELNCVWRKFAPQTIQFETTLAEIETATRILGEQNANCCAIAPQTGDARMKPSSDWRNKKCLVKIKLFAAYFGFAGELFGGVHFCNSRLALLARNKRKAKEKRKRKRKQKLKLAFLSALEALKAACKSSQKRAKRRQKTRSKLKFRKRKTCDFRISILSVFVAFVYIYI